VYFSRSLALSSSPHLFSLSFFLYGADNTSGTVGLSLGYPGINASLSGTFSTFSKLVIVAMEIRGRHRGLPYDVDRAVLLPSVTTPDSTFAPGGAKLGRAKSRETGKDEGV